MTGRRVAAVAGVATTAALGWIALAMWAVNSFADEEAHR